MIDVRHAKERGHANHGWLDTLPHVLVRRLLRRAAHGLPRPARDQRGPVAPGQGFGPHGHRDMEIISYVLEGALEHKDSIGTGSVIRPGDVQRMSAGTGVRHSEFNASPSASRCTSSRSGSSRAKRASRRATSRRRSPRPTSAGGCAWSPRPTAREGSLTIHQDARLYATVLAPGQAVDHSPGARRRHAWVQVTRGDADGRRQSRSRRATAPRSARRRRCLSSARRTPRRCSSTCRSASPGHGRRDADQRR